MEIMGLDLTKSRGFILWLIKDSGGTTPLPEWSLAITLGGVSPPEGITMIRNEYHGDTDEGIPTILS